jgi:DNA-binding beta-propeller fold protein YncE
MNPSIAFKPRRLRPRSAALIAALAAAALLPSAAPAQDFYRLESAVKLKSAAPDWDYITFEPARSYLYIGQRADGVTVYDVKARKLAGRIARSNDANGTALAEEFDRGYTVNGDGSTTVFRLSTLATLARIKFGDDADNAFYEPVTKQIAFMMGDSQGIAFLDAKSGTVVGKLNVDSHKLDGTAPDGQGNLFVALRDKNSVVRIDAKERKVTAEWKIEGCTEPTGLAFDPVRKRIFVGCRGPKPILAVLDSDSGAVVATQEIGRGNDGVVYDPNSRKVYTSNGVDGNLVIFKQLDANTYKLAEATTTRPYARTMALDPRTRKVYLVTAEGTVDPSKPVNRGPAAFYPNKYFPGTFTLLTYSSH